MNTQSRAPQRVAIALLAGVVSVPFIAAPASAHGTEVEGSGQTYFLSNSLGTEGSKLVYGHEGDETFSGDWDGNGTDTLAVRRGNIFHIDNAGDGGNADATVAVGRGGDEVVVGDWDGDGVDTFAIRRGNVFHIFNHFNGGEANYKVSYGRGGDAVVVGDWNGDGVDTLGIRRGAEFHLTNSPQAASTDEAFPFIEANGPVVSGDWDGNGRDDVAVRVGSVAYLRYSNGSSTAVTFGRTSDTLFAGDFNGSGSDSLAVRRPNPRPVAAPTVAAAAETAPAASSRIMSVARSKVGSRYVYGAPGPSSFDCSGFTSYVYRNALGINLPRNSAAQRSWAAANGRQVPFSQAQPGDFLYWPGHVGIYAGNGRLVDAANPSLGVSERRLWGTPQVFRIG